MARVLFAPYPESVPTPTPPQDYQRIDSSPAAFGALQGQAEQKAGPELSQTGNELTNTYSELSAQQANSSFTDKVNRILFGDPNTPGDVGYYGMHGQAAMDNRASTLKAIEDARQSAMGGLMTTQGQVMFNNEARYYTNRITAEIGRHYDEESKVWAGTVQTTSYNNALTGAALRYNDDDALTHAMGDATSALVKKAQGEGLLPQAGQPTTPEQNDLVSSYQHQGQIGVAEEAIKSALGRNDIARAQQLFDANKDVLSSSRNFDALSNQLRSHATGVLGDAAAVRAWGGGPSNAPPAIPSPATGDEVSGGGNWETRHNNFAGMRKVGVPAAGPNSGGFQSFDTPEQGIAAVSHQLDRYASGATTGTPLTTLRGIVSTWAPPSENDTGNLISRASQVTGFGPDQQLDLSDAATKAKVVEAMIRGEQGGKLPDAASPEVIARVVGGAPSAPAAQPTAVQSPTTPITHPPGMEQLSQAQANLASHFAQAMNNLDSDASLANDPAAYERAQSKVKTRYMVEDAQINAQKQVLNEQRSAAFTGYMQALKPGEPLPEGMIDQIHADRRLNGEDIKNLDGVIQARTKNTVDQAVATNGPGFFNVRSRILLPPGDPNRISDPSQLIALGVPDENGQVWLTDSGIRALMPEMNSLKNDPAAGNRAKRTEAFLKGVEPQIDRTGIAGVTDLKGRERFYEFQVDLDKKIADFNAGKGADPTDPQSPDYMGKPDIIKKYQRPFSDAMNDTLEMLGGTNGSKAPPAAAVEYLKAHPELRGAFDQKYGTGTSNGILGSTQAPMR